jgi:hypothetical protein
MSGKKNRFSLIVNFTGEIKFEFRPEYAFFRSTRVALSLNFGSLNFHNANYTCLLFLPKIYSFRVWRAAGCGEYLGIFKPGRFEAFLVGDVLRFSNRFSPQASGGESLWKA